jgi:hypothetical protein
MAFNPIMTHWFELGQGNKQYRDNTRQALYEEIKTTTAQQQTHVFAYHDTSLLPANREIYYYAVDALNENINMLNKVGGDSNRGVSVRYAQIDKLLKHISGELFKRQLANQGVPAVPQLVRQNNMCDLELEFTTDTMM